jgi:hypothetical protein
LLNCATLYRLDVLSNPAFFFPLAKTAKLSSVAHTLLLFGVPYRAVPWLWLWLWLWLCWI